MSPCNHALFEWVDSNGLCSYGNRFLAAIVLSFLKMPLTIVPSGLVRCVAWAFQDWISKVSRLHLAKWRRVSDWENEIKSFFVFSLILEQAEAKAAPAELRAAKRLLQILPASMVPCGGPCQRDPFCPIRFLSVAIRPLLKSEQSAHCASCHRGLWLLLEDIISGAMSANQVELQQRFWQYLQLWSCV